jgi:hypothetical protein
MAEKFLMPVTEEEGPDVIQFPRRGVSTFPQEHDGRLKSHVSTEMDWQGRAYHLATSFALPYSP